MGVHSNYNELQPVRNDVYHAVCASSVSSLCSLYFVLTVSRVKSVSYPSEVAKMAKICHVIHVLVPAIFWRNGGIVTSAERHLTLHDP